MNVATEDGVCKLLQNLDVKKAVGPDFIPNMPDVNIHIDLI